MTEPESHTAALILGGIEAGGTKFNCVIGTAAGDILDTLALATGTPETTLAEVCRFFKDKATLHGAISALGVASFGPIDLDRGSPTYGYIRSTPKPGWTNIDLVGRLEQELKVPVAIETDVNGSALGEHRYGAARDIDNFVYITVGTGLGGGVMINGQLLRGISHPEIGHMLMPQDSVRDGFSGCCPFHGNCLEGLASGTALGRRWRVPAHQLAADHPAWALEAHYLAVMCVNLTQCYSPQKIILGGGVMTQAHLFPLIRAEFLRLVNGYLPEWVSHNLDSYIVAPQREGQSGQLGALMLAESRLRPGSGYMD